MLGLPNVDALMAGFRSDVDGMREDLTAIRGLLEKLVEIGESK